VDGAKQAAFGWDGAECAALVADIDAFSAARAAYRDDNSDGRRIVKNRVAAASALAMRGFACSSVRFNRRMGAGEKAFLGVKTRAGKGALIPLPSSRPVLTDLRVAGGFAVGGRFHNEFAPDSRAVLRGCNGVLISFAVSAVKITDYGKQACDKVALEDSAGAGG